MFETWSCVSTPGIIYPFFDTCTLLDLKEKNQQGILIVDLQGFVDVAGESLSPIRSSSVPLETEGTGVTSEQYLDLWTREVEEESCTGMSGIRQASQGTERNGRRLAERVEELLLGFILSPAGRFPPRRACVSLLCI